MMYDYVDMIDVLEALGLLKFEEEKKTIVVEDKIVAWQYYEKNMGTSVLSFGRPNANNVNIKDIKPLYAKGD